MLFKRILCIIFILLLPLFTAIILYIVLIVRSISNILGVWPLYICGEIHYFRVPKPLWRDRLLKLKRAGGNCVSIYIPWNWHSPREDIVDFEDKYRQESR